MLLSTLKEILWLQFGASIDMLENAIRACPDTYWNTGSNFWYTAYHTIFFLDYYLSEEPDNFHPPAPFTVSELDPAGLMPDRVYNKEELLSYLGYARQKCHDLIAGSNEEDLSKRWVNAYRNYSRLEILLYNMRHVQHHSAQLNVLLRQTINEAPRWVSRAKDINHGSW